MWVGMRSARLRHVVRQLLCDEAVGSGRPCAGRQALGAGHNYRAQLVVVVGMPTVEARCASTAAAASR